MKVRDSGMPEEEYWESLLDVPLILDRMQIGASLDHVVELGCGYGTFTLPVARRIRGTLDTFDISADMIRRTSERASEAGVSNIRLHLRDVLQDGFGLPDDSSDAVLLFNILHTENPAALLSEAARVLRPGGVLQVIHWRHDPATPRGPSLDIRPRPEQIVSWAMQAGRLACRGDAIDLPPWHYGCVFVRTGGPAT